MKSLKKNLQSDAPTNSVKISDIFQKTLRDKKGGWFLSNKDGSPEIFFMLAQDIPAGTLNSLLPNKGITLQLEDDILKRLLLLEKDIQHLKSLSLTDDLTNLYNRRFFSRQLKIEIARTKRTGHPFCLMVIDLDNFKSVNDTQGHLKGDEFLVRISQLLLQKIRPTDYACRYGGDEFAVIMPATYLRDGISIAQRWHDMIGDVATEMQLNVSSSIGIDQYDPASTNSADDFFKMVDKELYNAKKTGKSKISYPAYLDLEPSALQEVSLQEKNALRHHFPPNTDHKTFQSKGD